MIQWRSLHAPDAVHGSAAGRRRGESEGGAEPGSCALHWRRGRALIKPFYSDHTNRLRFDRSMNEWLEPGPRYILTNITNNFWGRGRDHTMKLQIHARRRYLAVAIAAVTAAANQAWAADSCARFKWDVGLEHSLFLGPALEAQGAASVNDSPWLNVGTLYDLKLRPQEGVNFVHAPGKKMIADGAYAGVARFRVEQGGHYRISLGVPFWIDVVDGSELIPTADFGGSPGCDTPHKIVEYVLPPGRELVLQVSAGVVGDVKLSITRVAAAP